MNGDLNLLMAGVQSSSEFMNLLFTISKDFQVHEHESNLLFIGSHKNKLV
jgi:hypothetical protein